MTRPKLATLGFVLFGWCLATGLISVKIDVANGPATGRGHHLLCDVLRQIGSFGHPFVSLSAGRVAVASALRTLEPWQAKVVDTAVLVSLHAHHYSSHPLHGCAPCFGLPVIQPKYWNDGRGSWNGKSCRPFRQRMEIRARPVRQWRRELSPGLLVHPFWAWNGELDASAPEESTGGPKLGSLGLDRGLWRSFLGRRGGRSGNWCRVWRRSLLGTLKDHCVDQVVTKEMNRDPRHIPSTPRDSGAAKPRGTRN